MFSVTIKVAGMRKVCVVSNLNKFLDNARRRSVKEKLEILCDLIHFCHLLLFFFSLVLLSRLSFFFSLKWDGAIPLLCTLH